MISNNFLAGVNEFMRETANQLGLSKFKVEINQSFQNSDKVYIYFSLPIDISGAHFNKPKYFIDSVIKPIFQDIEDSPVVTNKLALAKEHIGALEMSLNVANEEIKRLKEFEVYYNKAFELEHGKSKK